MGEDGGAIYLYGLVTATDVRGKGFGQFPNNKEGKSLVLGIRVGNRQNPIRRCYCIILHLVPYLYFFSSAG